MLGEFAIAYYAQGPRGEKQMIAAYNPLNPEQKYSGVSVYEWAPGKYATPVFIVNDPSIEGTRIPPHFLIPGQEAFLSKVMHGNYALGSATSRGEFDPQGLVKGSRELTTVDGQLRLFDKILKQYEQRLKEGTVFADEAKIKLGGLTPPIFLREGLPGYMEYGVKYDESIKPGVYEGRSYMPADTFNKWVKTDYKDGVLRMTISMDEQVYRLVAKVFVCDMGGVCTLVFT